MKIYTRMPAVADCGVGYYRQWLPIETAAKKGKVEHICQSFTWGKRGDEGKSPMEEVPDKDLYKNGEWADILYFARNDVPHYLAQAGGMKEFFKKPIVLDIDDNVHATRPYNPGYRSFHPNSPNIVWNIKGMGIFDGFTVSTENLKEFYKEYADPDDIYVCPNSLNWKWRDEIYNMDFSKSKLFKKGKDEIRIAWLGSASHWENLNHIEKPIIEILRKYPNVTFYVSGLFGDLFNDKGVQNQIKKIPWAELKKWPERNREINADIGLAPLADNMFNRAKSNLRILEYASARVPVICSPIEPYQVFSDTEVKFATEKDEWFDAMEELIKDETKRKKLAHNLYVRAKKDFDIDKNYKIWVNAFKDIKKKHDRNLHNNK